MKAAFFGVNFLAYDILHLVKLPKDLLVTIDNVKANSIGLTEYCKSLSDLTFQEIYCAEKYSLNSDSDISFFNNYSGDIGIVIGWNRIIPDEIIASFKYGIVGLHGSPYKLPKGKGRSPAIWSIVLGEKMYYYYLFQMTAGVDEGAIWNEKEIEINDFDDINSLYKKLAILASDMINSTVPRIINGTAESRPQPSGQSTYFNKRTFVDGEINWGEETMTIYNLIRAITEPYPCAHTYLDEKIIYIKRAIPFSNKLYLKMNPGEICHIFEDKSLVIKTKDGTILVTEYEPELS